MCTNTNTRESMIDTIRWWLEVASGYLDLGLYAKLNPHLNPWVEMLVVDYLICKQFHPLLFNIFG